MKVINIRARAVQQSEKSRETLPWILNLLSE
jgi:hypothetical protein